MAEKFSRRDILTAGAGGLILAACGAPQPEATPTRILPTAAPATPKVDGTLRPPIPTSTKAATATPEPFPTPTPKPTYSPESKIPIADRIGAIEAATINAPRYIYDAFVGVTDAFSKQETRLLKRLREIPSNEKLAQKLIEAGRNGDILFPNHERIIAELTFTRYLAMLPRDARNGVFDALARSTVEALARTYDDFGTPRAIILQPGHQSKPTPEHAARIAAITKDREVRGVKTILSVSDDIRAEVDANENDGKKITEPVLAYDMALLVASMLLEKYPLCFPIIASPRGGYFITRFGDDPIEDNDTQYFSNAEVFAPLLLAEQRVVDRLKKVGVPSAAVALHFNDIEKWATTRTGDGLIIPEVTGPYRDASKRLMLNFIATFSKNMPGFIPGYRMTDETNRNLNSSFWDVDGRDGDKPADVIDGKVSKVRNNVNVALAQLNRKD